MMAHLAAYALGIAVICALVAGVAAGAVVLFTSAPIFLAGFPITIAVITGAILFAYFRHRRRNRG